jgi:flagellar biosynthetic protein FliR
MELPPGTLEAFCLYLARTSALVVSSPLFGMQTGFAGWKVAMIFAVSFLLYGVGGEPLNHSPAPVEFGCLVLREVLIGIFLGFTLQAVLVAVRVGGEMIGQDMGFNMATVVDPNTGTATPVIAQIYEVFFFLVFLALNGHQLILQSLQASFERAPVGKLELSGSLAWTAQSLFSQTFAAGIAFAAPVMILLFIASLLVGVLARFVPQLNVMDVGYSIRIGIGLLAMLVTAPFLAPALTGLHRHVIGGIDGVLDALGG